LLISILTAGNRGGNFIDTSSNYQFGESERIIGKWMKERGNREEIVLATKYGSPWRMELGRKIIQCEDPPDAVYCAEPAKCSAQMFA
jgi:aryl-alcohol dehydrogenase-like predicted oxidoreductase